MKDLLDELAAAHRALGEGRVPAGEAYTVVLRRRYDAEIEDVWDAITRCRGCSARTPGTAPARWRCA